MTGRASPPEGAPFVSVVVPVYNEEANLPELHRRLGAVLDGLPGASEMVFVDDGSKDGSTDILRRLASGDPRVKALILSRNFGQHTAIAAGFAHARGQYVALMDADLQDPPEELPKLLAVAQQGHGIVYGIRQERQDGWVKRLTAWGFFAFFSSMTGLRLPEGASTLRVVSRAFADAFNSLPERNRFTAGMMAWLGFSEAAVPVKHEARKHGSSRYNLRKLARLALDGMMSFSDFPLRLVSKVGFLLSGLSLLFGLVMAAQKLVWGIDAPGYSSIIVSLAFFSGVQLFFTGVLGEYLSRIYKEIQGRPLYIVQEAHNIPQAALQPGHRQAA
jgi:glycosyltransferase involved in cell wall biosynthesis